MCLCISAVDWTLVQLIQWSSSGLIQYISPISVSPARLNFPLIRLDFNKIKCKRIILLGWREGMVAQELEHSSAELESLAIKHSNIFRFYSNARIGQMRQVFYDTQIIRQLK